jgi:hypothetical protein
VELVWQFLYLILYYYWSQITVHIQVFLTFNPLTTNLPRIFQHALFHLFFFVIN